MAEDNIGAAILAVMNEVGYVQKERTAGLNYSYASEAALIAALRPAMLKAGVICFIAELQEIERGGYVTKGGTAMNTTHLHGIVRFEHPASETFRDVHAIGEGADPGDKSGNKAATGLLKYALRQTFLIETGDDPDTSASESQERLAAKKTTTKKAAPKKPAPMKAENTDAVTMFWSTANFMIDQGTMTREQAQEKVNLAGGNFVTALDMLTATPPEDNDED